MIEVLTALMIKHFLADYVFNPAMTPTDKHIYGSIGSVAHLATHMLFCILALISLVPIPLALLATMFDGFIHYHEDWLKTKYLHKRKGLSDRVRRIITGFDQLVHMLTYVVIAWAIT